METRPALPAARLIRDGGGKPACGWSGGDLWGRKLVPVWNGVRYLLGLAFAFMPLVAAVALAIMLLWTAAMAGSP